jgi:predicted amidohydrolase
VTLLAACGQFAPAPGEHARNAAVMGDMAGEAARSGAGVIVFPELALTGYLPPRVVTPLAVEAGGPEVGRLRTAAARARIAVVFGFPEKGADGRLHNSLAYVDARGELTAVYRKVHLFGAEAEWAAAGAGFPIVEAGPFRAGLWICYDTRFPETARALAEAGAAAAFVATAWLGPADEWELAVRSRAMDNGIFVAASAHQGPGFRGGSLLVDPHGRVLARGAEGRTEVVLAAWDPAVGEDFRARLPLLSQRRPDAYRAEGGSAS